MVLHKHVTSVSTATALLACVYVITCSPVAPPTTAVNGCYHYGKLYHYGENFGSSCSPCTCEWGGRVACQVIDCLSMAGMCVDSAMGPTGCCPTCLNGTNCMAHDGTIVRDGDVYHPNVTTACSCRWGLDPGSMDRQAVCTTI